MSSFCVSEGTNITLKDKTSKPIEEITIGEELLVFDLKTLEKTQKYNILVKLKTKNFEGIFKNSVVKNIWTNTIDKYYLINNKLNITGDHILLASRNNQYYWTKVENLLLNDLLFTEMNIFECIESIEVVNEEINVYNLEVNTYYNYFADSYLIHNGAPCSSCDACGTQPIYAFEWYYYAYGSDIGTIYIYWLNTSNNSLNLLRSISGEQHTSGTQSWDNYTENLTSYYGQTGRIVIAYLGGFTEYQDIQLDDMELRGTTNGNIDLSPGTSTGRGNWRQARYHTSSLSYPSNSQWDTISISTSDSWNYDSGGTPTSSTGTSSDASGSTSGNYLYFEGNNFDDKNDRYDWIHTTNSYTIGDDDDY